MEPSWRKPFGMILILVLITLWAVTIASFSSQIGQLPGVVQGIIYIIAGTVWIFPIKPLMRWMEVGRFW